MIILFVLFAITVIILIIFCDGCDITVVTLLRCRWHDHDIGDFSIVMSNIGLQYSPATSVTNIRHQNPFSNMRHQYRHSQISFKNLNRSFL